MNEEENRKLGEFIIKISEDNKSEQNLAMKGIYDIMSLIFYRVGNTYYTTKEDVEDSIQILMLKIYLNAKKYKTNSNACGWIMQIYRNNFYNFDKRRKRERANFEKQVQFLRDNNSDFEDYCDRYYLYNYVLSKLNKYEADLFYYKFLYDFSIGEIAAELNKPKSTVQGQLDRLFLKLKSFK